MQWAAGLPASDSHRIVERHFKVMEEQQGIDLAVLDQMHRMGARAVAVLDGAVQPPPVPVAAPAPAPMPAAMPVAPPVALPEAGPDKLLGLRARLGLT